MTKKLIEYLDVETELEPFMDRFERVTIRTTGDGQELLSSSPFREDRSPSFSLNLDTGLWIDFGSSDEMWGKGNFFQLIAFFTGEHVTDVVERYKKIVAGMYSDVDTYKLDVQLITKDNDVILDIAEYNYWEYDSNYLNLRGITDKAKRSFSVGYDKENKAIALPLQDWQGNYVNIKFRKTQQKQFYYLPKGQPAGKLLYGGHLIRKYQFKEVFLVESEIDALYLWSYGIPALALGTARMSKRQQELIELSSIRTLIISMDMDKAGYKAEQDIIRRLSGKLELKKHTKPRGAKDVNDMDEQLIKERQFIIEDVTPTFLNKR